MNKEITCRIIDGKPVVEYREEYVPKRGDIVVSGNKEADWIAVYDSNREMDEGGYYYQKMVYIRCPDYEKEALSCLDKRSYCNKQYYTRPATPEEAEVMHYLLDENGYELVNGKVRKKRWIPKMWTNYYFASGNRCGFSVDCSIRSSEDDSEYGHCFKTEQACQAACDKMNEFLLTLPQE